MRPIQDVLPGALRVLLRSAPLSPGKVRFTWGAAVGAALDRATSVRLDARILVVETDSPQWALEVNRLSEIILARMHALLGAATIDHIEVRVSHPPP
jgi:Dna[CI] antecedent, DciA